MCLLLRIENLESSPVKAAGYRKLDRFWFESRYIQSTHNAGDTFKNQSTSLQFGGDGFRRGRTLEGASGWRLTITFGVQSLYRNCCQRLLERIPSAEAFLVLVLALME
jgi:hypothetical protein